MGKTGQSEREAGLFIVLLHRDKGTKRIFAILDMGFRGIRGQREVNQRHCRCVLSGKIYSAVGGKRE